MLSAQLPEDLAKGKVILQILIGFRYDATAKLLSYSSYSYFEDHTKIHLNPILGT